MNDDTEAERARTRRVFVRVMILQIIALVLLWVLQSRYTF
jgi:hypothetical protein